MAEKKNIYRVSSLRKLAEEKAAQSPADRKTMSPEETQRLLHELRVHQIELEMQNDELRTTQSELDAARARYFDLYDLAPVGYCTVSQTGLIMETNLTAATLFDVTRAELIKQPISSFILKEDQDIYYLHRKKLFETGEPQTCEMRMLKKDGTIFWAHLTAVAAQATSTSSGQAPDCTKTCRIVMSDITKRKKMEAELKQKMNDMERFHNLVVGRELRMIELKKEINDLLQQAGQEKKYKIVSEDT
jgi:PAS domain S-box-containing protein